MANRKGSPGIIYDDDHVAQLRADAEALDLYAPARAGEDEPRPHFTAVVRALLELHCTLPPHKRAARIERGLAKYQKRKAIEGDPVRLHFRRI